MEWKVEIAKDGNFTLKLNNHYLYSKYRPFEDAKRYVITNIDRSVNNYFIFGLGLGYHIKALKEIVPSNNIYCLLMHEKELETLQPYIDTELIENVNFINLKELSQMELSGDSQFLVPLSFLNALEDNYILKTTLNDFKLKEMSYRQFASRMEENFYSNTQFSENSVKAYKNLFKGQTACLISSGPSLDEDLSILKEMNNNCFIMAVGSALKVLIANEIQPHAVVLSDPKVHTYRQFENVNYDGPLFFLSTACKEIIQQYEGKKVMLYQNGYPLAIEAAKIKGEPLFEVGGSVAILAFLLLEYLGFEQIVLCGQDLGFKEGKTHSKYSTSGMHTTNSYQFGSIEANNGEIIKISKSLKIYHSWFEKKIECCNIKVWNTALEGARIKGAPYINKNNFKQLLQENINDKLNEKIEVLRR